MTNRLEAVVIGTGFGGAVNACRLSRRWPNRQVLVLERGKRYPMGAFARSPRDFSQNFWDLPEEHRSRPKGLVRKTGQHGLFDFRNYRRMDVLVAAGLGGGSLIYANVLMEPPDHAFSEGWPQDCRKSALTPYYSVVRKVLGATPIPPSNTNPRRRIIRTEVFQHIAEQVGREFKLVDLAVLFGEDPAEPLGVQRTNRYGALQTSCVYCAECCIGCNTHSKNSLDLNYLHVAENRYRANILTEHLACRIVPVNAEERDDPAADGSYGYHVYFQDLNDSQETRCVLTNRVVLSAGTLGSTELLLRLKDQGCLPRISSQLGRHYSGNGDFLAAVINGKLPANPNYGPVITQRIDFNLFNDFKKDRAFVVEDASYPAFIAWFVEAARPDFLHVRALLRYLRNTVARVRGLTSGPIGWALNDILKDDLSYRSSVLLSMGIDSSDGVMTLDSQGQIEIDWKQSQKKSRELYKAIVRSGKDFKRAADARYFVPLPSWYWPFRQNVSVHSLGGCALAETSHEGVTNSERSKFGEVFGYRNLYVADGALVPRAVGANPALTIAALSERVAEGITGIAPEPDGSL